MTNKHHKIIWGIALSVIVLGMLLLNAGLVWSATVNVPIRMHFGEAQDSIRVQIRAFNTVTGTFVKASTGLIDTIIPMGDDTVWQVYLRAYKAPDSARSWTYQLNRRYSQGPIEWPVEMYWAEPTDSVRCKFYKDSTVALSYLITGLQSFDSAFTCYRGDGAQADTSYSLIADLYYQGQTIPASWIYQLEFNGIDTGQSVDPPPANRCRLFATIRLPNGDPAKGALVTVTRGGAYNAVSSTSARYAVTADAISERTDSLGKFEIDVVGSDQFADTANAYYNVKAQWRSVELFRVSHIYCPSNTAINVLDTLSAR